MSRSASSLEGSARANTGLTPDGVAHWRAEVQAFFADALAQLSECIECLESEAYAADRVGPSQDLPSVAAKATGDVSHEVRVPSPLRHGDDVQDRRLAELAQRLEAKLKESKTPRSRSGDERRAGASNP